MLTACVASAIPRVATSAPPRNSSDAVRAVRRIGSVRISPVIPFRTTHVM
jgi:hypothetical protein